MSREEKRRALDTIAEDVLEMLRHGWPLSLVFFVATFILARWVI